MHLFRTHKWLMPVLLLLFAVAALAYEPPQEPVQEKEKVHLISARSALNEESLGVPVVALGVPTVVDARIMCRDLAGAEERPVEGMFVTPRDIASRVKIAARLAAYAVNMALHEGLTPEDIDLFLS